MAPPVPSCAGPLVVAPPDPNAPFPAAPPHTWPDWHLRRFGEVLARHRSGTVTGWLTSAACKGASTDLFFADDPTNAKALCSVCPVRVDCLAAALVAGDVGVWGGVTDSERRRFADRLHRAGVNLTPSVTWFDIPPAPTADRTLLAVEEPWGAATLPDVPSVPRRAQPGVGDLRDLAPAGGTIDEGLFDDAAPGAAVLDDAMSDGAVSGAAVEAALALLEPPGARWVLLLRVPPGLARLAEEAALARFPHARVVCRARFDGRVDVLARDGAAPSSSAA